MSCHDTKTCVMWPISNNTHILEYYKNEVMNGFHGNTLSNQPLGRKLSMGNGQNIPQLVKSGQFVYMMSQIVT